MKINRFDIQADFNNGDIFYFKLPFGYNAVKKILSFNRIPHYSYMFQIVYIAENKQQSFNQEQNSLEYENINRIQKIPNHVSISENESFLISSCGEFILVSALI